MQILSPGSEPAFSIQGPQSLFTKLRSSMKGRRNKVYPKAQSPSLCTVRGVSLASQAFHSPYLGPLSVAVVSSMLLTLEVAGGLRGVLNCSPQCWGQDLSLGDSSNRHFILERVPGDFDLWSLASGCGEEQNSLPPSQLRAHLLAILDATGLPRVTLAAP
ncbi:hypothetical protein KIL84_015444 [Mauremys mutica]|uniref:Uncharacterized protein n=1 Tax=Mauremys mutica TaxID=74926 RepID=A0A9D4AM46_9SAUR|nr:hypothetical protein KIL84_015444 [Mauremys mutica]